MSQFSHQVMSDFFVILWSIAFQAPLSMGFSREEYWSGLLSPSPEDLPDPGIKPMSPALAGGFFTTIYCYYILLIYIAYREAHRTKYTHASECT